MCDEKLINRLEDRERTLRKNLGVAKREGNVLHVEYYKGHIHEIESLLFILQGGG